MSERRWLKFLGPTPNSCNQAILFLDPVQSSHAVALRTELKQVHVGRAFFYSNAKSVRAGHVSKVGVRVSNVVSGGQKRSEDRRVGREEDIATDEDTQEDDPQARD